MTQAEVKDILMTRIGWKEDKTITGFVLSPDNAQTDSGRYFQSENPAVTLLNIKSVQPVVNISESDFNDYLKGLKEQVIYKVLSDCLERDYISDDLMELFPTAFDNAISLRMVIDVAELIMTSVRSNRIERFGDIFVAKLNYDIYREAPNKFAVRSLNFKHSMGITTRYAFELDSLQRRFGSQRNRIKTITAGQAFRNELYDFNRRWN